MVSAQGTSGCRVCVKDGMVRAMDCLSYEHPPRLLAFDRVIHRLVFPLGTLLVQVYEK